MSPVNGLASSAALAVGGSPGSFGASPSACSGASSGVSKAEVLASRPPPPSIDSLVSGMRAHLSQVHMFSFI